MIRMGESGLGTLLIDVQIDIDTRENTTVATSEANKVPPHGQAVFLLDTHSREVTTFCVALVLHGQGSSTKARIHRQWECLLGKIL